MKKKTGIIVGCVVVAGIAAIGIGSRMGGQDAVTTSAPLADIVISASSPERGDLEQISAFIGTIEPDESVQVYPKMSGTVLKTYAEVGQEVKKGQLLYEFDPVDVEMNYAVQAAELESKKVSIDQTFGAGWDSSIEKAEYGVSSAQLALQKARNDLKDYNDKYNDSDEDKIINLGRDQERKREAMEEAWDKLEEFKKEHPNYRNNPTEKKEYDDLLAAYDKEKDAFYAVSDTLKDEEDGDDALHRSYRLQYETAQKQYENALYGLNLLKGQSEAEARQAAEAGLKAIETGLEAAAKQIEYTKVYAPIDGVIEQKNVTDNNPSASSSAAYIISNKAVMTARFSVSESVVVNLEVGDAIEIENGGKKVQGTILEIPTAVDAQTGLFNIKASVDSDDILLHTGAAVKIYAATQKADDSILIPLDSVYYDAQQPYIYVYRDGKAVKVEVETGVTGDNQIEIISGLSDSDKVINTWHPRLLDGAEVVLKEDAAKKAAASEAAAGASSEEAVSEPAAPATNA